MGKLYQIQNRRQFKLLSILLLSAFAITLGYQSFAQRPVVENVNFTVKQEYIEISYDLVGDLYKNYKVTVELRKETDPDFKFEPYDVKGDVGKGWFAGQRRIILWDYRNEFSPDPDSDDYYFVVTAKKPGKAWLYLLGGAALAGTAAVVTSSLLRENDENPSLKFPVPGRP
jgi:hypothetical protein